MTINPNWLLLPCWSLDDKGKCRCRKGCKSPGKHPKIKNGLLEATNNWTTIESWIKQDHCINLAVRTGPESGIWVLDINVDCTSFFYEKYNLPMLPDTLITSTPRGFHFYFNWPKNQSLRNRTRAFENVDVRGANGYCIIPGINNNYKWLNNLPIVDAPIWLLEKVCGT